MFFHSVKEAQQYLPRFTAIEGVEVVQGSPDNKMCIRDRTTLRSALLVVVDADTVTAAGDQAGIDAVAAQAVDSGLTDRVCRELGEESCVQAVVSQRDSDISLAAAEGELQAVGLNEALVVEAVSYTHLDVYKRQKHSIPACLISSKISKSFTFYLLHKSH